MSRKKTPIDINFSNRLKELIQKLNISQSDMGAKLRITQSYLSAVVNGKRGPSAELIAGLFLHYSHYLQWLLTGSEDLYNKDRGGVDIPPDVGVLLDKARRVLTAQDPVAKEALEKNIVYFASKLDDKKAAQPTMEDRLTHLEETCEQIVGEVKAIKKTVNKFSSQGLGGGDLGGSSEKSAM